MVNNTTNVVETVAVKADNLNTWIASGLVGDIVIAIVIVLIGFVLGRIAGKSVTKLLKAVEVNLLLKKTGVKLELESFIGRLVSYLVYILAVLMALDHLGVRTFVLQIILVAVIVLFLLSLLLSVRDFLPNFFAGMFAVKNKLVKKDDNIKIDGVEGKVDSIGVTSVRIKTKKGNVMIVPNSHLIKSDLVKKK